MGTGTDVAIKITLVKGDLQGLLKATKSCSHEKYQSKLFLPSLQCTGIPIAAGVLYPFSVFTFANDCSTIVGFCNCQCT
jgi:cation transport ATPase